MTTSLAYAIVQIVFKYSYYINIIISFKKNVNLTLFYKIYIEFFFKYNNINQKIYNVDKTPN